MGLVFAGIGIWLLIYSMSNISDYADKNKSYVDADSVVVDYKYDYDGLKAIIVEYVVNGKRYTKTSDSYSSSPKNKGEVVKIKYNPNNPSDAIWRYDETNILFPLFSVVSIVVGAIFAGTSLRNLVRQNN